MQKTIPSKSRKNSRQISFAKPFPSRKNSSVSRAQITTSTKVKNQSLFNKSSDKPDNYSSEMLKNMNFCLNPQMHRRQVQKINTQVFEKKSNFQTQPAVVRNIKELRDRTNKKNISLFSKPKIAQTSSFKKGSLSIIRNNSECRSYITNKYQGFVQTGPGSLGEKGKDRLRWQVAKWFCDHQNEVIQILNDKKQSMMEWVDELKSINKQEFELMMEHVGVKKDKNLFSRLFWLLDLNSDESINSNEIYHGFNLFKEDTIDDKIKLFFELADTNHDGLISVDELKVFFGKNLISEQQDKQARFLCQDFVSEIAESMPQKGFLELELQRACDRNQNIRMVVEKNTRILKTSKHDQNVVPLSSLIPVQETDQKTGSFYRQMDLINTIAINRQEIQNKRIHKKDSARSQDSQFGKQKSGQQQQQGDSDSDLV